MNNKLARSCLMAMVVVETAVAAYGALPGASYTHYRFKVDAIHGASALGMQISELALLCDGENVTRKNLESVARAEPVPKSVSGNGDGTWNGADVNAYQGVTNAIDGTTATKFYDCNASFTRSNAEYRDKCWVELAYTNAVRVTAYRWATADDCVVLDEFCRAPKDFRLQGSNDGETWTDIDVQTNFAPPTSSFAWTKSFPVGGAMDVGGYATDAKWFRWTILRRQDYNLLSGWTNGLQVAELELYDADGNRVNTSITAVAKDTATLALNPGEATWSTSSAGSYVGSGTFDHLMDGDLSTKFLLNQCRFDSVRNIKVVFRLPESAAPVAGYNLVTADDAAGDQYRRSPVRWTFEASYDGETWFTLDDRRDIVPPELNKAYYNSGIPFAFRGPAPNDGVVTVGAFDANAVPGNPIVGRGKTVRKVGVGTLDYAGGIPSSVEVGGGVLTIMPTFSKFRFKTDALPPKATASFGVQLAELMLFDGWTNVTYSGFTAASKATGPVNPSNGSIFTGNTPSLGVDGQWYAGSCYYDCNISPTRSYDPNFDMCHLQVEYSSPRRVTSYAWATAHDGYDSSQSDSRNPYDFRLQGSNDGETWTDLDVRTGFVPPNASNTMTRAFSCPAMHDIARGTSAKYFRLTIKSKQNNSVNSVQVGEFGLFDANGTRVNANLVVKARDKAASSLVAGEATASAPSDKVIGLTNSEGLPKLFDGYYDTKFLYGNGGTFNVNDSSTWLVITMRLRDDAPDVYGYGFATANDAPERDPDVWLLEASEDGETWTKLDERSGYKMTTMRRVWDMYCMPFSELAQDAEWCVSNVCVAAGATLNVGDDHVQIGGLTVDCAAGGGTISRFNVAESGTINLVNKSGGMPVGYALPVTVGEFVNAENLRNWSVTVNGRAKKMRALLEDGVLRIYGGGFFVFVH